MSFFTSTGYQSFKKIEEFLEMEMYQDALDIIDEIEELEAVYSIQKNIC